MYIHIYGVTQALEQAIKGLEDYKSSLLTAATLELQRYPNNPNKPNSPNNSRFTPSRNPFSDHLVNNSNNSNHPAVVKVKEDMVCNGDLQGYTTGVTKDSGVTLMTTIPGAGGGAGDVSHDSPAHVPPLTPLGDDVKTEETPTDLADPMANPSNDTTGVITGVSAKGQRIMYSETDIRTGGYTVNKPSSKGSNRPSKSPAKSSGNTSGKKTKGASKRLKGGGVKKAKATKTKRPKSCKDSKSTRARSKGPESGNTNHNSSKEGRQTEASSVGPRERGKVSRKRVKGEKKDTRKAARKVTVKKQTYRTYRLLDGSKVHTQPHN